MKKIAILLLLLFLIPINTLAAVTGDVDGNGKVQAIDYLLVKKHILGTSKLTGDSLKRADVDEKNGVTAADYLAIKKIILNGSSSTPTPSTAKVTGISFSQSSASLETSDTYTINYLVTPSNAANKNVTWQSSNTKVATVSNGVVTTNSLYGTTVITGTTIDGGYKAQITINVTKDRIHFINIGEAGNAILLDSYSGGKNHYVLIDAATCKNNVDCGKNKIVKYIGKVQPVKSDGTLNTSGGIKKLDAVVVTHMHYDHAGYMAKIIEQYKPSKVIIKKYSVSKSYLNDIKSAAKKAGSTIVYPSEGNVYTFGNYKLKFYNTSDVIGSKDYSENANSFVIMASLKKGDKTYLTYLPGDLEMAKNKSNGTVILDPANISRKIQSDYGLSSSRPVDIYVASHHGYYDDDGSTGVGISAGVNNAASTIAPLYIKNAVVTNTFGWLCSKTGDSKYQGMYNIYNSLASNNGNLSIRFSGANRVKAIFRAKGLELSGGEVLNCNQSTCGSKSAIHNTIKKAAPQCARKNYTK